LYTSVFRGKLAVRFREGIPPKRWSAWWGGDHQVQGFGGYGLGALQVILSQQKLPEAFLQVCMVISWWPKRKLNLGYVGSFPQGSG